MVGGSVSGWKISVVIKMANFSSILLFSCSALWLMHRVVLKNAPLFTFDLIIFSIKCLLVIIIRKTCVLNYRPFSSFNNKKVLDLEIKIKSKRKIIICPLMFFFNFHIKNQIGTAFYDFSLIFIISCMFYCFNQFHA